MKNALTNQMDMLGDMAYSKLEAMACYLVKQACCNDILASVKIKLCSLTWKTGNINTQVYLQLKPSFRIAISDTKFKHYLITSILAEVPAYLIRFWASRWVNFDVSWVQILCLNFSLKRETDTKIARIKNWVVNNLNLYKNSHLAPCQFGRIGVWVKSTYQELTLSNVVSSSQLRENLKHKIRTLMINSNNFVSSH